MHSSPTIIIGAPRSGTTALTRLLAYNSDRFTNETALFDAFVHPNGYIRKKIKHLSKHNSNFNSIYVNDDVSLHDQLISVYEQIGDNGNIWGDKFCDYIFRLDSIMSIWPKTKIIYIYRDGRDVVGSYLRLGWHRNIKESFMRWVKYIITWENIKNNYKNTVSIRQEDILSSPEEVGNKLSTFLDIQLKIDPLKQFIHTQTKRDDLKYLDSNIKSHYWKDLYDESDIPHEAKKLLISLGYTNE